MGAGVFSTLLKKRAEKWVKKGAWVWFPVQPMLEAWESIGKIEMKTFRWKGYWVGDIFQHGFKKGGFPLPLGGLYVHRPCVKVGLDHSAGCLCCGV